MADRHSESPAEVESLIVRVCDANLMHAYRKFYPNKRLDSRSTSRTAVVRTRTPGGVTGKTREGLPMSIFGIYNPFVFTII